MYGSVFLLLGKEVELLKALGKCSLSTAGLLKGNTLRFFATARNNEIQNVVQEFHMIILVKNLSKFIELCDMINFVNNEALKFKCKLLLQKC